MRVEIALRNKPELFSLISLATFAAKLNGDEIVRSIGEGVAQIICKPADLLGFHEFYFRSCFSRSPAWFGHSLLGGYALGYWLKRRKAKDKEHS